MERHDAVGLENASKEHAANLQATLRKRGMNGVEVQSAVLLPADKDAPKIISPYGTSVIHIGHVKWLIGTKESGHIAHMLASVFMGNDGSLHAYFHEIIIVDAYQRKGVASA